MTDMSGFTCFFDEMDIDHETVLLSTRALWIRPEGAKWVLKVDGQRFYFDDNERFIYANDGKRLQLKDQRLSEEAIAESALREGERQVHSGDS